MTKRKPPGASGDREERRKRKRREKDLEGDKWQEKVVGVQDPAKKRKSSMQGVSMEQPDAKARKEAKRRAREAEEKSKQMAEGGGCGKGDQKETEGKAEKKG
jgi:hypothetical protein